MLREAGGVESKAEEWNVDRKLTANVVFFEIVSAETWDYIHPFGQKGETSTIQTPAIFVVPAVGFLRGAWFIFVIDDGLAMNVTLVWGSVPSCSWDQIHDCYSIVYLGGGVLNMFYFHPENWGRWTQFDEHIFQMGWFNHQPGTESSL